MPRRPSFSRLAVTGFFLLGLTLSGCAPTEPLDTRINASSSSSFMAWRSQIEPRLSAAQRTELVEALQELKLAAMIDAKDTVATGLDAQVRARIHDRPLREFFIDAWTARLKRLAPERDQLREALAHNGRLRTTNSASAEFLALRIERQTQQLATIETSWSLAQSRLAALGAPPAK